jgi:hypothetical protein
MVKLAYAVRTNESPNRTVCGPTTATQARATLKRIKAAHPAAYIAQVLVAR